MTLRRFTRSLLLLPLIGVAPLAASTLAPWLIAPAMAASARMGDISPFRTIVVDTQALVGKGDLAGAKTRIKDLETSWDDAEPSLKPRSAKEWHTIDRAIDRALTALRAGTPDAAACRQSLAELLTAMDAPGGAA